MFSSINTKNLYITIDMQLTLRTIALISPKQVCHYKFFFLNGMRLLYQIAINNCNTKSQMHCRSAKTNEVCL